MEPLEPSITSLQEQTQAIFEVINATARLGDACAALYPDALWKVRHAALLRLLRHILFASD